MALYDNFIEELRQKLDIVEVIGDYVKLELKGKSYTGLCPFHQEKTPSFNVSRDKQLYYCFGCGAGGDTFNFIMEIENLPFFEAAKLLAQQYGVPIPEKEKSPAQRVRDQIREQLFEIHQLSTRFYSYLLSEHELGSKARDYFLKRGFSNEMIQKFRLGYAPDAWTALFNFLKKKGYSESLMEQSGLVLKKRGYYDRFRNRAMFCIFNPMGTPIGFGGRVMNPKDSPKYLNSPETLIFIKNENLYGLNFARDLIRKTRQAIIMEGYTDVITAHQYGIENAVASLGTSLTVNQARLLARYADEVFIAYDADTAGESATLRGLDILKEEGLVVKVIRLGGDRDPDDFIRTQGADAFRNLLEHAVSLIDFKLEQIVKNHEIEKPEGKVQAVEELLPVILSINNAIEKDYFINEIVEKVKISRPALETELTHFIQEKSKNKDRNNKKWNTIKEMERSRPNYTDAFEARFIYALLQMPEKISQVFAEISVKAFQNPLYRSLIREMKAFYDERKKRGENSPINTSDIVESLADDKLRDELLHVLFKFEESKVTEDFIHEGLNKIKEYQKAMEMETILKEVGEIKARNNLTDLNQALLKYHRLLHQDSGKGGC